MQRPNSFLFRENFPDDLNIRHKITPATEKDTFHLHPQMEIIYTLSDNLVFFTDTKAQPLPAHTLLLLDSMSLHYIDYIPGRADCDRYVLYFNPDIVLAMNTPEINLLDCFIRQPGDALVLPVSDSQQGPIQFTLEQMASFYKRNAMDQSTDESMSASMDRLYMRLELGKLLLMINRILYTVQGAPESASYQLHSQQVTQVCQYIDMHYWEPLTVDMLAHEFLMSRTRLYSLFKEVLHISVTDYLSNVRLSQAKSLLISTDYSVEIISQKVGYANLSSFSRVFKSNVGCAPLQYRKRMQG